MGYPIQEQPLYNKVATYYSTTSGGTYTSVGLSELTNIDITRGSTEDLGYIAAKPGVATITYKNLASFTYSAGSYIRIYGRQLTTDGFTRIFTGIIMGVAKTAEYNAEKNAFDFYMTVEAGDMAAKAGNTIIPEFALITGLGLSHRVDTRLAAINAAVTTPATAFGLGINGSTSVNQTISSNSLSDELTIFARTLGADWYNPKDSNNLKIEAPYYDPTAAATFTDGTHTTIYGNLLKYSSVDASNNINDSVKSFSGTVPILKSPPVLASEASGLSEVYATYEQSDNTIMGVTDTFTVIPATTNPTWNFLPNSWMSEISPSIAARASFAFQPTTSKNYGSRRCIKVLVTATYTSGAEIRFNDENDIPELVSNTPGGTTGNFYFRCYIMASSAASWSFNPQILWYNAAGTLISTTTGTAIVVSSTTTWTSVGINGAPPVGAVTARAKLALNTVQTAGNFFYVTNASFVRGGYTGFDGDNTDNNTYLFFWSGSRQDSPSVRVDNTLITYSNLYQASLIRVKNVTVNHTENITPATTIDLADTVYVAFNGVQDMTRISEIKHSITPYSWETTYSFQY